MVGRLKGAGSGCGGITSSATMDVTVDSRAILG